MNVNLFMDDKVLKENLYVKSETLCLSLVVQFLLDFFLHEKVLIKVFVGQ